MRKCPLREGLGSKSNKNNGLCQFMHEMVEKADEISKNEWNDCAGLDHPFTRYEFFHALEKSKSAVHTTGYYLQGRRVSYCPTMTYDVVRIPKWVKSTVISACFY